MRVSIVMFCFSITLESNAARKFESCGIKDLRSIPTLKNLWLYCFKTFSQRNEHIVISGTKRSFQKIFLFAQLALITFYMQSSFIKMALMKNQHS